MSSFDAIVIGAGVNGMACAARLAQAGRRVLLVDGADAPGGAMAVAHLTQGIDPRVAAGLDLTRRGLRLRPLATTALARDGAHLTVRAGLADGPDAAAWAALHTRLTRFAAVLAPLRTMTPPRLAQGAGNDWKRLARLGLGLRGLGRNAFREFLRMFLINVADVAEDELTDDRLRGLMAFDATLGAWLGPRSPNSLIGYLNRLAVGADPLWPVGGMAAVAEAMAGGVAAAGVQMRLRAKVALVLVEGDRAQGVVLADGHEVRAALVVSAISPAATLRDLVGPRHLDTGLYRSAGHIRARGAAARLDLTLSEAPDFRGADPGSRLVIAPSASAVEQAWNPVKYGQVPERPVLEIVLPAALDGAGPPRLSALVQFAPHAPRDGADAARAALLRNTMAVLEDYAPGIGGLATKAALALPGDIAARHGPGSGCWHQAELSVEQMLFLRPLQALAQYATPLPGLWLAGAGSHPGGGVNGAAGWNAAERIIAEVRG